MKGTIRSTFWYDVTREMRRAALDGRLENLYPEHAESIRQALLDGGSIVFSPDEGEFYRGFELDQILHDPGLGQTTGVRRL